MNKYFWPALAVLLLACAVHSQGKAPAPGPLADEAVQPAAAQGLFEVAGKTQCAHGRKAVIAPTPLHPVVEVLVAPGDKVKKGQALVKLDDDEPKADVRAKKAAVENARVVYKEAQRHFGKLEDAYKRGSLPEATYFIAHTAVLKAEQDVHQAEANLAASEAELEHYTTEAMIDGVVAWLDVHLGTVSRPGTTIWGEILDLSEIDVRCEVTPAQADQLAKGQKVEVITGAKKDVFGSGHVQYIGIAADPGTGLVPVLVHLANPDCRLRAGVPVRLRFLKR